MQFEGTNFVLKTVTFYIDHGLIHESVCHNNFKPLDKSFHLGMKGWYFLNHMVQLRICKRINEVKN